ncbi:MAG TPA: DUF5994 family protein [Thermomonospora sp.]|nr:DUF5994 family protein [Thermomonospora sp.]
MAHDTDDSTAARVTAPPTAPRPSTARLSLAAGSAHRGALDGGWWPRSRDARAELAELVAALAEHLGRVTHLALDPECWEQVPDHVTVAGRQVKVGPFPGLGHMIAVIRGRRETFLLLVIPPEAEESRARAALSGSAAGAASGPAEEILTTCDIRAS